VRFRWYGSGIPELVFVERKTHREAWTQEVSVKVGALTKAWVGVLGLFVCV
jgi:SPX domain protein involved in polyphosphate accumulation